MPDLSPINSPRFLLRLLGSPAILGPGGALGGPAAQRHRLALLALLATAPRGLLARDRLLGLLWPETDMTSARRLLNNAVHVIRQAVGEEVVISEGEGLRLDPGRLRVDVLEFEVALKRDDARAAAELYTGPFLDGLSLPDAVEFEQWQERERERLEQLYHVALERLAEATAREQGAAEAVLLWRQRLACTPADSRIVLRLMHVLAEAGDRAGALQTASAHATVLREEFGAAPDAQVETLAEQLRRESVSGRPYGEGGSRPVAVPGPDRSGHEAEPMVPPLEPPPKSAIQRNQRRRRNVLLIGALCTAIGGSVVTPIMLSRPDAPAPPWTVVADVQGTADPAYRLTLRELVRNELDRSGVIRTVPTSDIVEAMGRAGKPPTAPITTELARELAVRHSLRTIIDARLDRVGAVYSLSLRAVDAEEGTAIALANDTASGDDAIIAAVQRATQQLRRELSEQRALLGAGRDPAPPATPSFEAFRMWAAAMESWDRRFDRRARIMLMNDALVHDSAFTDAWLVLAEDYSLLDLRDSALLMVDLARRHTQRVTELDRLRIDERHAYLTGDRERSLALNDRLVLRFPENPESHFERAIKLRYLGQFDAALEASREGAGLSPFGPPPLRIMGESFTLLSLGRHEEAWQVAQRMGATTATAQIGLLVTGLVAGKWAEVERLTSAFETDSEMAGHTTFFRAGLRATSGRVREASDSLLGLETTRPLWIGFSGPSRRHVLPRTRMVLSFASHVPLKPLGPFITRDASLPAQITQAYWAALAGDTTVTRQAVVRLHNLSESALIDYGAWPQFLDALIAARRNDWNPVMALAPIARDIMGDIKYRFQIDAVLPSVLQWFVAHAYEQTARPDSAAYYYALIASPRVGVSHGNEHPRAAVYSLAHQRLVVLYARLGRLAEARRHWNSLHETFTQPDPALVALVDEARDALRNAERTAR